MNKEQSGIPLFYLMKCRKCENKNPMVFFAPVDLGNMTSSCICLECAVALGFATSQGDLKEGVTL